MAVASREREGAEKYAREWKIGRAHGSYEALLADPEVDVIYNSLPNQMHADWSIKALRAGKHVLCEKPLAVSVREIEAMSEAAAETGRVLAEAFMYRHHPQTLKVQEMVERGSLGELRIMHGAFSYVMRRAGNVRLIKELGGGSLWDVGCYPVNFMRMIAGEEPVEAFGWQVAEAEGVDETFAGQLRFASGVLGQFDCGFRSAGRAYMEIVGSEGILEVPEPFKPGARASFLLRRGDLTKTVVVEGGELYGWEVKDMEEAVLDGKPPRISLKDSRGNVAAIAALLESASSGRAVRL